VSGVSAAKQASRKRTPAGTREKLHQSGSAGEGQLFDSTTSPEEVARLLHSTFRTESKLNAIMAGLKTLMRAAKGLGV
jgi:hypothetical protein